MIREEISARTELGFEQRDRELGFVSGWGETDPGLAQRERESESERECVCVLGFAKRKRLLGSEEKEGTRVW